MTLVNFLYNFYSLKFALIYGFLAYDEDGYPMDEDDEWDDDEDEEYYSEDDFEDDEEEDDWE
ncbi:hypothetical protein CL684_02185 [Candidatus Campbellbacteria bacterium]|nr:hypothetical protein [Candidatus Campbellbacteria bacterium]|tara:strand:- start:460 stop:645 length:186 start_codon:yes stop_codon:yes gene_type:complete